MAKSVKSFADIGHLIAFSPASDQNFGGITEAKARVRQDTHKARVAPPSPPSVASPNETEAELEQRRLFALVKGTVQIMDQISRNEQDRQRAIDARPTFRCGKEYRSIHESPRPARHPAGCMSTTFVEPKRRVAPLYR